MKQTRQKNYKDKLRMEGELILGWFWSFLYYWSRTPPFFLLLLFVFLLRGNLLNRNKSDNQLFQLEAVLHLLNQFEAIIN